MQAGQRVPAISHAPAPPLAPIPPRVPVGQLNRVALLVPMRVRGQVPKVGGLRKDRYVTSCRFQDEVVTPRRGLALRDDLGRHNLVPRSGPVSPVGLAPAVMSAARIPFLVRIARAEPIAPDRLALMA